jgi:hypothetical protein
VPEILQFKNKIAFHTLHFIDQIVSIKASKPQETQLNSTANLPELHVDAAAGPITLRMRTHQPLLSQQPSTPLLFSQQFKVRVPAGTRDGGDNRRDCTSVIRGDESKSGCGGGVCRLRNRLSRRLSRGSGDAARSKLGPAPDGPGCGESAAGRGCWCATGESSKHARFGDSSSSDGCSTSARLRRGRSTGESGACSTGGCSSSLSVALHVATATRLVQMRPALHARLSTSTKHAECRKRECNGIR